VPTSRSAACRGAEAHAPALGGDPRPAPLWCVCVLCRALTAARCCADVGSVSRMQTRVLLLAAVACGASHALHIDSSLRHPLQPARSVCIRCVARSQRRAAHTKTVRPDAALFRSPGTG
jgi:hypothetical protein